jgi:hypothetical protein
MQPAEVLSLVTDALEMLRIQWMDVQAVLTTQGDILDVAYLRKWAAQLAVGDLLDAALRGDPPPRLPSDSDKSQQARMDF